MTDISGGDWISDSTANRYKQTYLKGFIDISYGDVTLHHGNVVLKGENRSGGSGGDLIVENGNVGIGTNSPSSKLEVAGTITADNVGIGTNSPTGSLHIFESTGTTMSAVAGSLVIEHGNDNGESSIVFPSKKNSGSDYGYIKYQDTTSNNTSGESAVLTIGTSDDADDHIALMPSGNVGIGTNTPSSELEVAGTIAADNVGIGTNSPGAKLHVHGGALGTASGDEIVLAKFEINNDNSSHLKFIYRRDANGTDWTTASTKIQQFTDTTPQSYIQFNPLNNDYGIALGTDTGEALTIRSNKNVGIGTTTPSSKLEVAGTISAQNYLIRDGNNFTGFNGIGKGMYGLFHSATGPSDDLNIGTGDRNGRIGMSIVNDDGNSASLQFHTHHSGQTWRTPMTIKYQGHVGIGTNNPGAPLHVESYVSIGVPAGVTARATDIVSVGSYWSVWNATGDNGTAKNNYAIYTSDNNNRMSIFGRYSIVTNDSLIAAHATVTFSDSRIKDNIVDVQDDSALETLRQLKPKKYTYKDVVDRGEDPVWGFIAQEVRETLPYSVTLMKQTIPNIYEMGSVSGDNHDIVTLTTYKTSDFSKDASANLHKTIEFRTITDEIQTAEIIEVIDEYTFKVDKDLSDWSGSVDSSGNLITETQEEIQYDTSGNEVVDASGNVVKTTKTTYPGNEIIVYGQEVDDFHGIKKDAIWTITTAALQEVDRQLQEEKQKTSTLESQVADLLTRVTALENA